MSNAWRNGSTATWRKLRVAVLDRDGWICQLCGRTIPRGVHRDDPLAPQVHHTRNRALVGDDPNYLQATHRKCNLAAGEPGVDDPEPHVGAWW